MRPAAKKAITAGTTFSVALSIGFLMQYGDALASRIGIDDPIGGPVTRTTAPVQDESVAPTVTPMTASLSPAPQPVPRADAGVIASFPDDPATPQMVVPRSTDPVAAPVLASTTDEMPVVPDPAPVAVGPDAGVQLSDVAPVLPSPDAETCDPAMTASVQPLAMVQLVLLDACRPDSPVTIHHQGMMFSALTDASGKLQVAVPALARDALFIADFKTGTGAAASVVVPEVDTVDRAVLQWQGDDGVQLHALEFGAGYDDAGHIWSAATGDIAEAQSGRGGFLVSLGDDRVSEALRAEVYTFPTGQVARDGDVVLNVEAEITSRNCGRDVAAQSIQIGPDRAAGAIDLTMTMPGCDAIGEFLVLKNMFADLTLAAK